MILSCVKGVGCHILAILENLLLGDFVVITSVRSISKYRDTNLVPIS